MISFEASIYIYIILWNLCFLFCFISSFLNIVQFLKTSILPYRRDWNFLGGGGSLRQLKWNFQMGGRGGGRSWKKNPFYGGGMDIF